MTKEQKLNIRAIIDQNIIAQLEIRVGQDIEKINKLEGIINKIDDCLSDFLHKVKNDGSSSDFVEGYKTAIEDFRTILK